MIKICNNDILDLKRKFDSLSEIPSYILITVIDRNNKKMSDSKYDKDFNNIYSRDAKINFNSNELPEDIIEHKGQRYKLDSCLISNYEYNEPPYDIGHILAGITCKDNKYLYNGWLIEPNKFISDVKTRQSRQSLSLPDSPRDNMDEPISIRKFKGHLKKFAKLDEKKLPCKLLNLDWSIGNDINFCIDVENCGIKSLDEKDNLCFSFNKGSITLIYVKNNMQIDTGFLLYKNESALSPLIIPSPSSSQ